MGHIGPNFGPAVNGLILGRLSSQIVLRPPGSPAWGFHIHRPFSDCDPRPTVDRSDSRVRSRLSNAPPPVMASPSSHVGPLCSPQQRALSGNRRHLNQRLVRPSFITDFHHSKVLPLVARPPMLASPIDSWFVFSPERAGLRSHKLCAFPFQKSRARRASFARLKGAALSSSPAPLHRLSKRCEPKRSSAAFRSL